MEDIKKTAVIIFHKNIYKIYKKKWIDECVDSILSQTYQKFDIFEVNYGNEDTSVLSQKKFTQNHYFFKRDFSDHTEAMTFLLNKCFLEYDIDVVFNTNLDDYYHLTRFEKQISAFKRKNILLCSSNWDYIKDDSISLRNFLKKKTQGVCILKKILKENIVNHSGIAFRKEFWFTRDRYDNFLRYRNEIPEEDFKLWKRCISDNVYIGILSQRLIFYRIHPNQTGLMKKRNVQRKVKRNSLVYFDDEKQDIGKIIEENKADNYFIFTDKELTSTKNNIYYFHKRDYEMKIPFMEIRSDRIISLKNNTKRILYPLEYFHNKIIRKMNNITFVTCWYNLKCKFPEQKYRGWISNFLGNVETFNLVIYTDKNSLSMLESYKHNDRIKIIILEKENWELYKLKDQFSKNHQRNHLLNSMVEEDVIMLWCQKTFFVKKAIQDKIFESDYYGWCDIGYFRNSTCKKWPRQYKIDLLHRNKIYYTLVNRRTLFVLKNIKKRTGKVSIPADQISIAGGFFIGHREKCTEWCEFFETKLNHYFSNNMLVKDDQIIILDCILENESFFELINGGWFNFKRYLL